ncbi:MAG: glycogen debranching enzyme N-terminal domain-containing protein [Sedimentisphaerales bacterium]|nr:glycogen debranching enzyme N-terminal domain-containing protein [Sedimentisphaerales bacterium]
MPQQIDNISELVSIDYQPRQNRNMLQFSVLQIRVQVTRRDPDLVGPLRVMIRTNLNQAGNIRRQIIDAVEKGQHYSTDYYDISATYDAETQQYMADILLYDVGYFEFKVRAESTLRDRPWVRWADGPNVGISVTPLEYARNNSIYCAFIRQFVENKNLPSLKDTQLEETIKGLEDRGAFVLPPGGNFANFLEALPFIIRDLGMKIIHFLPINPVPTSYGRMGMYGSPYATTDYFGIDHTYASFSKSKTIEDQFIDVTSTIHGYGGKVFLDMVINHTGWASSIAFTHKHWIEADEDRRLVSPGAWGVVWEDLIELNYEHQDLWQYMAQVFLVWCERGVDGFRLDAGYMVPLKVWRYIISKVRQEYPNTVFLLEGLGGPWETTERLLTDGQMNWAYSELFQNYSRKQILDYLAYAQKVSSQKGVLVHYAETHDNDRLAKKGAAYARMRLYVCGFTSFSGAWGFANGVEWLATEKINVHRNSGLNWGAADNLVEDVAQINRVLAQNPAFWRNDNIEIVDVHNEDILAFIRRDAATENFVICAINLNVNKSAKLQWNILPPSRAMAEANEAAAAMLNLLTDDVEDWPIDSILEAELPPGRCVIYSLLPYGNYERPKVPALLSLNPDRIALIYKILLSRFQPQEIGRIDQDQLLNQITDFRRFIVLVNTSSILQILRGDISQMLAEIDDDMVEQYSDVWTFRSSSKQFIISGDKWLMVHTFVPCTAYLQIQNNETLTMESIACGDEPGHMVFFPPLSENESAMLTFNWKIQRDQMIQRQWESKSYPILSVPSGHKAVRPHKVYPLRVDKEQLKDNYGTVLLTNGHGLHCQCPALPGVQNSKYESMFCLAPAGTNPTVRCSLVKTIRETVQVGRKFYDLDESFFTGFTRYPQPSWRFTYNDGQYSVVLERTIVMPHGENTLYVSYRLIDANTPVRLYVTPCVECRNPHEQLKASNNPQLRAQYEQACQPTRDPEGVSFKPASNITLSIFSSTAEFVSQPAWTYNLQFPQDAHRGLDPAGDIFSPGTFDFHLQRGDHQSLVITSEAILPTHADVKKAASQQSHYLRQLRRYLPYPQAKKDNLVTMLISALDQFVVRTPTGYQFIAGYPWLPVGSRDALLSVGGLLSAGRADVARDVITSCAQTEREGLLAEWITGAPPGRVLVEPSLRLFIAVGSYAHFTNTHDFWDVLVGDRRTLREILVGIYESFTQESSSSSVPSIDPASGMLYCPGNSSWMRTTDPVATPRGGYPIEIQALWYRALKTISEIYPPAAEEAWEFTRKIESNFIKYFWNEKLGYAADVLLRDKKGPAEQAVPDMALRFNQLAAIQAGLLDKDQTKRVIDIIGRRLLIPAAVRSLAEEPLTKPLQILDAQGKPMIDPLMPYQGRYEGNETQRRLASYNGTAWLWAYPSYVEAYAAASDFSEYGVRQALAFLNPMWQHFEQDGLGTFSEMQDANYPHTARGCFAYAITTAEALRVYMRLRYGSGLIS